MDTQKNNWPLVRYLLIVVGVLALTEGCTYPPVSTDATYLAERRQSQQLSQNADQNWAGDRSLYIQQIRTRIDDFNNKKVDFKREAKNRSGEKRSNLLLLSDNLESWVKNLKSDISEIKNAKSQDSFQTRRQAADKDLARAESVLNAGTAIASQP